jgi:hypothetical protein
MNIVILPCQAAHAPNILGVAHAIYFMLEESEPDPPSPFAPRALFLPAKSIVVIRFIMPGIHFKCPTQNAT